jgi:ribA/ribD-fused uncharacterized protein
MNKDLLISSTSVGLQPKWLFFWGHTPAKDGHTTKSCFSQWWDRHPFVLDGITYPTAEHWMMAEKARLFGDSEACARILAATHPNEAKRLGRQVRGFDDARWRQARWDIVIRGNNAKFGQHSALRDFLLATGDRVIVEASPYDRIWGIGMAATHLDAEYPARWRGENLLGFALMEMREILILDFSLASRPNGAGQQSPGQGAMRCSPGCSGPQFPSPERARQFSVHPAR